MIIQYWHYFGHGDLPRPTQDISLCRSRKLRLPVFQICVPFGRSSRASGKSCRAAQSILPAVPSVTPSRPHLQTVRAAQSGSGTLAVNEYGWLQHRLKNKKDIISTEKWGYGSTGLYSSPGTFTVLQQWFTCVSNSVTSRFSLFRCLLTNVINVCWEKGSIKNSKATLKRHSRTARMRLRPPLLSLRTFFTTFSLSGAWSNRVSKASRSVKHNMDTVTRCQHIWKEYRYVRSSTPENVPCRPDRALRERWKKAKNR